MEIRIGLSSKPADGLCCQFENECFCCRSGNAVEQFIWGVALAGFLQNTANPLRSNSSITTQGKKILYEKQWITDRGTVNKRA